MGYLKYLLFVFLLGLNACEAILEEQAPRGNQVVLTSKNSEAKKLQSDTTEKYGGTLTDSGAVASLPGFTFHSSVGQAAASDQPATIALAKLAGVANDTIFSYQGPEGSGVSYASPLPIEAKHIALTNDELCEAQSYSGTVPTFEDLSQMGAGTYVFCIKISMSPKVYVLFKSPLLKVQRFVFKTDGSWQGAMAINDGATYTTEQTVTVNLSVDDTSQMYLTETAGCGEGGVWEPYAATRTWAFAGSNKELVLYGKFKDDAGSESVCLQTSINHDDKAPSAPQLVINEGAAYSSSSAVTLNLSAEDAVSMYVSNTSGCSSGGVWEGMTASKAWTLSQTNAQASVFAKFKDAAGNESACVEATVIHDDIAPTADSLVIAAGAAQVSSTNVALSLGATGASHMLITNSVACAADGPWQAYSSSLSSWTLGQTNTTASVYAKFQDEAGNSSACISASVVHDGQAPANASVVINGGAASTTSSTVNLTLAADGAAEMYITNAADCSSAGSWETFASSKSGWALAQSNVTAYVYAKFRDTGANESACVSASILHDDQAPSGGSLLIDGGAASTASALVTLTLSATGAAEMYVTNTVGCTAGGTWEAYAASKAGWTLGQTNATATVNAKFRDSFGNESACIAATIIHDDQGPSSTSISIAAGATHTSASSVALTLAATSAADMYITNTSGCGSGGSWEAYATSKTGWGLTQTDGTNTIYAKFRDSYGNESACISDAIVHDDDIPTSTSISIAAAATYTKTASVTLTLAATGAAEMYISNTSTCASGGSWETYATSKTGWTLAQTNTTATVYAKFRDEALNESACTSDTIVHDSIAPSDPTVFTDGVHTLDNTAAPTMTWTGSTDSGSGLAGYEVAIGTTAGAYNTYAWTTNGTATSASLTGLTLTSETVYYGSVRAVDNAGNNSAEVQGNGFVTGYVAALDTGFNTTGVATHTAAAGGTGDDVGNAVAVQTDGKIIVVGYSYNGTNKDMAIWRYKTDGTLDTTFNTTGYATHAGAGGGTGDEMGSDVALQSDGKIVVVGHGTQSNNSWSDFVVWRFNTNGTLDTTFNTVGYRAFGLSALDEGKGVVVQSDGKIVIVGLSYLTNAQDLYVARLNADGSFDTSFNLTGYLTHDDAAGGVSTDVGNAVALQSDGKIVVTGQSIGSGTDNDMAVWRFNTDGTLDTDFNSVGYFTHNSAAGGNNRDIGYKIAVASDGKLVVSGTSNGGGSSADFAIWRLNTDGTLDTTFNTTGYYVLNYNWANDHAYALQLQSTGKIIYAGYAGNGGNNLMVVGRLNSNGTVDTTFGASGRFTHNPAVASTSSHPKDLAWDSSGYLLGAGERSNGTDLDMAVWRLKLRE